MSILKRKKATDKKPEPSEPPEAPEPLAPPVYEPVYGEPDSGAGEALVRRFWGTSNGSEADLAATVQAIRDCRLSREAFHKLRASLPVGTVGTTGSRIARIDRALKSLEKGA